jgi:solute:Na+ symporter, SSS family
MNLTALVTVLYTVGVLVIGWLTTKKKGGAREFFVAGGNLPWILLTPFLMAEYISGSTTVGVAESAHKTGISIFWYYFGAPIGLTALAYGFARFYQKIQKVTVGEAFGLLFDRKTRLLCVLVLGVLQMVSSSTAFMGLATILAPMFGLSYEVGIVVSVISITVMALIGLRGQAWMNVIHFAAIILTFLFVAIAAVGSAGGLNNLIAALPATHLNPWDMGVPTTIAYVLSSSAIKLISLTAIVAMFAARSERDAKIGAISTGFTILAFTLMPVLIGLCARVLLPGISSKDALYGMGEYLGGPMPALVSIGVVAAIVSTTPGILLSLGALAARDCYRLAKPACSEGEQINICRIAIIVIAVVGATVAYVLTRTTTIMSVVVKVVEVRTVIVIPLLVSVVWRRVDSNAAFWTVVSGVTAGITWLFVGSHDIEPFWPAIGVGLVVMVVISLFKKPLPYKGTEGLKLDEEPVAGDS